MWSDTKKVLEKIIGGAIDGFKDQSNQTISQYIVEQIQKEYPIHKKLYTLPHHALPYLDGEISLFDHVYDGQYKTTIQFMDRGSALAKLIGELTTEMHRCESSARTNQMVGLYRNIGKIEKKLEKKEESNN